MPTYQFLNTDTGEEFQSFMKISEREEFLSNNPHIQPILSAPSIVGGVSVTGKVPDGFKEVLSKISENHKGSNLAERHGSKGIKDARTGEVVKKHVDKITKRLNS